MKVVLAGGTGFLGSAVAEVLLGAGHSVVVLTRSAARARGRVDQRAELTEWDGRSSGPWERTVADAGGIVNLTGEPIAEQRWTDAQKQRLRSSRLEPLGALVHATEQASARPSVLVSASAVGYYGPRGDEPLDEDAPPGDDFLARLCQEWESAARAAEPMGTRVVVLRFGVVLGAGGGALQKIVPPFKLFVGGPLGSGRQWMSWIHRDDVAGLCRFVLENDAARGPINATAPEPVTNAEFSRTLGRVLGRPSCLPAPAPALRLLLGEMADMLLTGQRVEPHEALRLGHAFRYPQLEPALRAILGR